VTVKIVVIIIIVIEVVEYIRLIIIPIRLWYLILNLFLELRNKTKCLTLRAWVYEGYSTVCQFCCYYNRGILALNLLNLLDLVLEQVAVLEEEVIVVVFVVVKVMVIIAVVVTIVVATMISS